MPTDGPPLPDPREPVRWRIVVEYDNYNRAFTCMDMAKTLLPYRIVFDALDADGCLIWTQADEDALRDALDAD